MNQSSLPITAGLALACLLASFAMPMQSHAGKGDANTQIAVANDGIGLSFAADTDRQFLSMTVRVAAPGEGIVFSRRSLEPVVQWMPDPDAPDGYYRWEAWVVTADSGAVAAPGHASRPLARQLEKASPDGSVPIEQRFLDAVKQVRQESGTLELRDGWLRDVPGTGQELSALESSIGTILSFIVPPARAVQTFTESVEIEEGVPAKLFFDDTNLSGINWTLQGGSNQFGIIDAQANVTPFFVREGAPSSSLSIDDTGNIGLGTAFPNRSLEIVQEDPSISLRETDSSTQWNLRSFNGDFHLQHFNAGFRSPFQIESDAPGESIYVDTIGRVGLGVNNPTEDLTISGDSLGAMIGMRTDAGTATWQLGGGTGQLFFRDLSTGNNPLALVLARLSTALESTLRAMSASASFRPPPRCTY